jgi:hypothetical protein
MFEIQNEENFKKIHHNRGGTPINQDALTCQMHKILCDFEEHLEHITTKYKTMAFTCFLAVCLASGFVLSIEAVALPFNHFVAVTVLSCIGFTGITLLWHLDVNVYQRFLAAVFIEETILEKKFSFLPQSGSISFLTGNYKKRFFSQNLSYLVYNFVFLISISYFSFKVIIFNNVFLFFFLALPSIGFFLVVFFAIKSSKRFQKKIVKIINKRIGE